MLYDKRFFEKYGEKNMETKKIIVAFLLLSIFTVGTIAFADTVEAAKWKKFDKGTTKDKSASYTSYQKSTNEIKTDFYIHFKKNKTKAGTLFISKTGNNIKTYILNYKGKKTTQSKILSKKSAKKFYNTFTSDFKKQGTSAKYKESTTLTWEDIKRLEKDCANQWENYVKVKNDHDSGVKGTKLDVFNEFSLYLKAELLLKKVKEEYEYEDDEPDQNKMDKNSIVGTWKCDRIVGPFQDKRVRSFKSDGTIFFREDTRVIEDPGHGAGIEWKGTYSIVNNGKKVKLKYLVRTYSLINQKITWNPWSNTKTYLPTDISLYTKNGKKMLKFLGDEHYKA